MYNIFTELSNCPVFREGDPFRYAGKTKRTYREDSTPY